MNVKKTFDGPLIRLCAGCKDVNRALARRQDDKTSHWGQRQMELSEGRLNGPLCAEQNLFAGAVLGCGPGIYLAASPSRASAPVVGDRILPTLVRFRDCLGQWQHSRRMRVGDVHLLYWCDRLVLLSLPRDVTDLGRLDAGHLVLRTALSGASRSPTRDGGSRECARSWLCGKPTRAFAFAFAFAFFTFGFVFPHFFPSLSPSVLL